MPPEIIDPFYRSLYNELIPQINNKAAELCAGRAIDYATYREEVGYIRALNDVLDKCAELERTKYGTGNREE
jgi:hypothetical protein